MYYRMTIMQYKDRDALLKYADSIKDQFKSLPGLQSMQAIDIDPENNKSCTISCYDSKENADSAMEKVHQIMAGMADMMVGPPERMEGDVFWEM